MGAYTSFKDGYAFETTFGTSTITGAGDSAYLFGAISQKSVHPSPTTTLTYAPTAVNEQEVADGQFFKNRFELMGLYGVGMQNGVLINAVMGGSSTTGPVGGIYTHTIDTASATAGVLDLLPSFVIHHERTGTATVWRAQFTGCKATSLTLVCGEDSKFLIGMVEWQAKKAQSVAFSLTNDPALPATANAGAFHFANMTRTYDSVAIDGLKNVELTINPDLAAIYTRRWDTGVDVSRYLKEFTEGTRKKYSLTMDYTPGSQTVWDALLTEYSADADLKDIVLKWSRDSSDDYIQATLTSCQVLQHPVDTPPAGEELLERVVVEPRSITFVVKDKLTGGSYGE